MQFSEAFCRAVERRIENLTLLVGIVGALAVASKWGYRAGLGLALGAGLSWLNFRWLEQGVNALFASITPSQKPHAKVADIWIYARFVLRMALLVVGVYVILKAGWFPGRAVLAGLFSLILAVLIEVTYEVVTGFQEPGVRA